MGAVPDDCNGDSTGTWNGRCADIPFGTCVTADDREAWTGDVNGDGITNAADGLMFYHYSNGWNSPPNCGWEATADGEDCAPDLCEADADENNLAQMGMESGDDIPLLFQVALDKADADFVDKLEEVGCNEQWGSDDEGPAGEGCYIISA